MGVNLIFSKIYVREPIKPDTNSSFNFDRLRIVLDIKCNYLAGQQYSN